MGIEETLKLIDVLESGGIQIMTVDFEKVAQELNELDWTENKELGLRLLELAMSIISSLSIAKNPVISFILPISGKIIKALA